MDSGETYNIRLSDGQEFGPATMAVVLQWAREGRVPVDALLVKTIGNDIKSVLAEPDLKSILQAPPTVSTGLRLPDTSNQPGPALIPYRNMPALIGYYLAVFSILLFPLGIVAFILGIVGLVKRSRDPKVRGAAHAWVAIILGGITGLGVTALIIIASLSA